MVAVMKRFQKPSSRAVLAVLLGCSLLTSVLGRRAGDPLRNIVRFAIVPPGDGAMYMVTWFKSHQNTGPRQGLGPEEAKRMLESVETLRQQVFSLIDQRDKWWRRATIVNRLRARFGATASFPYELIPARVVSGQALPYGSARLVAAGESRGVVAGAPVTTHGLRIERSKALPADSAAVVPIPENLMKVTSASLVGRIFQTGEFSASLRLVTDRAFKIQARIHRTGKKLIDVVAAGDGKDAMIVRNVSAADAVRPGNLLVSRSSEDFLPAQVAIGKVVRVTDDPDHAGFVILHIKPHANLPALREVYIIVPRGGRRAGGSRR